MTEDKKEWVKEFILATVKSGGAATLALTMPGACELFRTYRKLKKISRQQKYYFSKTVQKLITQKSIVKRGEYLSLTEKGKKELIEYETGRKVIKKPKIWDGKYRVIIFDIPEEKKKIRWALRKQLIEWEFVRLQNSVWVHPYECQEVVALLKTSFGISKDVLYLTVDSIENDQWLRKEFGLSSFNNNGR
jgi:DNA-binding transcriptional regulator PaaX